MPTPLDHRHSRQAALLALLQQQAIARQDELVRALAERGHAATQSSVSRDLRELGVVKVRGRYLAPKSAASPRAGAADPLVAGLLDTLHYVRDVRVAGPHLVLVITAVGAAQTVAIALDRCAWPEVVGTLGGDDTIFVATAGPREQTAFLKHFDRLRAQAEEDAR